MLKRLALIMAAAACGQVLAGDCLTGSCGCDNGFRGGLTTSWPGAGSTYESGVLFDAPVDDGATTSFNFNGRDYLVPDYALQTSYVNYTACTFHIAYNGDPIFRDVGR